MEKNYFVYKNNYFLLLLLISVFSFGQTFTDFTSGTGKTWTVPAGVTSITIQVWGAGGGGGNSNDGASRGGSGGGGGAYATGVYTVVPGSIYYYTVGTGGTGGPANSTTNATSGSGSWFNATAATNSAPANSTSGTLASGGGRGINAGTTSPANGGSAVTSYGNVSTAAGSTGTSGTSGGGGNGGNAANPNGGLGGLGGDTTGNSNGNGQTGTNPGGGGGGANDSSGDRGGNGGNGRIIITWCPVYSLTSVVATDACEATKTSTVTLSNTTTANLPIGTYAVTYTLYGSPRTAIMNVTTAGTGTFTADVNGINPTSSAQIIITKLELGSCSSTVNNNSNNIYMYPNVPSTYGLNSYDSGSCTSATVQWQNIGTQSVTKYYLDVSTSSVFSTFLSGYNNRDMGTNFSQFINGLTTGTTYYYRVRTNNLCGTSPSVSSSFTLGAVGGTANSNQNICANNAPSNITLTGHQGSIQWQVSSNSTTFTDISGANSATLTSAQMGVLTATRYYRAKVNYSNCTVAYSSTVTVSVTAAPTASISYSGSSYCKSLTTGSVTQTGTSGGVYSSSAGLTINASTGAITPSTSTAGTYTVTYTYGSGVCTGLTTTASVTISAIPTASISYSGSPYCKSLTTGSVTQTGTSGGVYSSSAGLIINASTGAITSSTSTAGTYTVTYTYGSGGCTGLTTTTSVTILDLTAAPTVGTITQPTCSTATGSVVLNNLPSGSWRLTRSPGSVITTGTGTSTTISGLSPGTYTYVVDDLSKGLKGEYFNTIDLSGAPTLTRTDATVNFDWGNGAPDPLINSDGFSVRWSGFVEPLYNQTYTFRTNSDDGIRLWVNGVQVIDNWTNHAPTINTGTITLTAGTKYNIVLEYYENSGGAVAQLSWSSLSQSLETIPVSRLDPPLTCSSVASANVVINAVSVPTSPTVGTITQPTCSTATGSVVLNGLPAGAWVLTGTSGNNTTVGSGTSTTISGLTAGTYNYTVSNLINGLKAEYFNTIDLSSAPTLTRTDATVNFDWGNGSPDPSIGVDNFSVRWSGFVEPLYSEIYTFRTNSDDGVRLWVNGVRIINDWNDHGPTPNIFGTITLVAGVKYNIVLEYYERGGGALAQLSWQSPSQALQIIPQNKLFSAAICVSAASANVVINSQPVTPLKPTISTITPPTCNVLTGSFTITNYNSSYTYLSTPSLGVTISGNTVTAPAGTYTITASLGSCISVPTDNIVVAGPAPVTWNGSVWSSAPTINSRVEFTGGIYNSSTNPHPNINACSCYITGTAEVTFNSGNTLYVKNEVQVAETAKLIFEDKSSLVQENDLATNDGSITYRRNTTISRFDYTYWSSPVKNWTLKKLSNFTLFDRYFTYDPNSGWQVSTSGAAVMKAGHGYNVRGPQTYDIASAAPFTGTFIGEPNNGVIKGNDLPVAANKNYLLGNPYPSAINADEFLRVNSGTLQGTLYFWTHNTPPAAAAGTTTFKYTASDYATYNRTGGTGTVITGGSTKGGAPKGSIAAGQGFFAPTIAAGGDLIFNNKMRLSATATVLDNSQFYKVSTGKTTTAAVTTEKSRIWLNFSNKEGAFKQALIGYIDGATNDYDDGFDGMSYNGNQYVDFYSVNQDKNLTIQGRALPFVKKDTVALGYKTTIKGDFTISIDQVDGILTTQNVLLEDKDLKVQHDLKKEAYTFNTDIGTFNNRFVLRYVDKNAIEIIEPEIPVDSNTAVLVSIQNGEITVNSPIALIDKLIVYDLAGRKRYQNMKIANKSLVVKNILSSHQVLVVKTTLENGEIVTSKIVY